VFSKLETKQWADPAQVISNTVQYLSTSPLEVYVTYADGDKEKLQNIPVTLTPFR